jgi:hypothetical protein
MQSLLLHVHFAINWSWLVLVIAVILVIGHVATVAVITITIKCMVGVAFLYALQHVVLRSSAPWAQFFQSEKHKLCLCINISTEKLQKT